MPLLFIPSELLTNEFWRELYDSGRFGADSASNLLLLIIARLAVVGFILLAARLVVDLTRRVVKRAFRAVTQRSAGEQQRLNTLQGLIASSLSYLVYIFALIPILFALGLTWKALGALFATSSIALIAIGLGSQKLVRDLVNGLFIMGEGQFDVGDWVTIGGVTGRVEEIGLRVTRLRDEQGRLFIIANGDISQVFNASRGNVKLTIELSLMRTAGLDTALQALRAAAVEVLEAHEIAADGEHLSITLVGMDAAKVTVRLMTWAPQRSLATIEDEIRRRLLQAQEAETLTLA